jgi:hypothetical protein
MPQRGRPKKIQGQTAEARKFLELYLDPLITKQAIIRQCRISQATFYNYEKELNLPQMKVAIGCPRVDLPWQRILSKFKDKDDLYELNLIRQISPLIQARIKLVPTLRSNVYAATYALKTREADLAISSMSMTAERRSEFYFSNPYFKNRAPHGFLLRKKRNHRAIVTSKRPILGVVISTVHAEFAQKQLQTEFQVITYRTALIAFKALNSERVDFLLFHPSWFKILPEVTADIEICSRPYCYQSQTGILFHADSESWRPSVNRAIEVILDAKTPAIGSTT